MELVSFVSPDATETLMDRLSQIADVRFSGEVAGANVPGANSYQAEIAPDTQPITIQVAGIQSLPAIHEALQELGCRAWVPRVTEQGVESVPLEEFLRQQVRRIEWR